MEGSPKIILAKTPDGKTKRVLVKRVKRVIKLKTVTPPTDAAAKVSSPAAKHKKITADKNLSAQPPTQRSPRSAQKTKNASSPVNKNRRPSSGGVAVRQILGETAPASTGYAKTNKRKSKIYITKKDAKRSSSFERASSKRKLKRSSFKIHDDNLEGDEALLSPYSTAKTEEVDVYANVPKKIEIGEVIPITKLAHKLNLKASQLIKKFFALNVVNLRVTDSIDADAAQIVCSELGCEVTVVSLAEQTKVEVDKGRDEDYVPRPPILTIMGHVDHGKTTLLQALTGGTKKIEAGDITQHISVYAVKRPRSQLVFLDTPGHSAFFSMRAKGMKVTDFLMLIVALPEGLKQQTLEVLALIKASKLPMIVVVTKADLVPEPNERAQLLKKLKNELLQHEVTLEEWGGKVAFYVVSAQSGEGIEDLLVAIENLAAKHKLTGNPQVRAYGYVLESQVVVGRGNVATMIIKNGSMRVGDAYLCYKAYGHIRALFNERDEKITVAGPSNVVRVIGLSHLIPSGQFFQLMGDERKARITSERRYELEQMTAASNVKKITVSNLFSTIKKDNIKELRLIIKADTYGSAEAIHETLKQFKNEEVATHIVHFGVGGITENDAHLAATTQSIIIAFKLKTSPQIKALCQQENVTIRHFEVIYDIINYVKEHLSGLLDDDIEETKEATAAIKEIFKISGVGKTAGCQVNEGKLQANQRVRIIRDDNIVYTGTIASLRRFKDNVNEVVTGQECGVAFENFENFQVGDVLESFTVKTKKKELKLAEKAIS